MKERRNSFLPATVVPAGIWFSFMSVLKLRFERQRPSEMKRSEGLLEHSVSVSAAQHEVLSQKGTASEVAGK